MCFLVCAFAFRPGAAAVKPHVTAIRSAADEVDKRAEEKMIESKSEAAVQRYRKGFPVNASTHALPFTVFL